MSPGALSCVCVGGWGVGGSLVFKLVCRFHRYWAYSSVSTVWPKMKSCFQDGACSVCFRLHSSLLMLLTHSMSTTPRDILHPGSPTTNLGQQHQPLVTKFIIHCKMQGPQSRTIKATVTMVNIVFCQSPFTQDRTEVQKGMFSLDIAFTWFFMSSKTADTLPDKSGIYTQHSTLIITQVHP